MLSPDQVRAAFAKAGVRSHEVPADDIPPVTSLADFGLSADAVGETDVELDITTEPASTRQEKKTGTEEVEKPKLRSAPVSWWRDPATIPPRQSLYDGHYIRRTIGATIGGGGRA